MMREAAASIASVRDQVTAIGATAVQIAISGEASLVSPTLDVDFALPGGTEAEWNVRRIIGALEAARLSPSEAAGEAGFTWVGEKSKIQLISGFTPFKRGALRRIPVQPGIEPFLEGRVPVAFLDEPDVTRFYCVDPASLLGLKQRAFGRVDVRGISIERDFADAHLLMRYAGLDIAAAMTASPFAVRSSCRAVIDEFSSHGNDHARRAAVQLAQSGLATNVEEALVDVRRAAVRLGQSIG